VGLGVGTPGEGEQLVHPLDGGAAIRREPRAGGAPRAFVQTIELRSRHAL
jgi:hypothetical protein